MEFFDIFMIVVLGFFVLFLIVSFFVTMFCENTDCILSKFPQNKELFKIKSYRKAFIKKYKLQQKNEMLIKRSVDNLKEIEILDIELSVYEDKYFKNGGEHSSCFRKRKYNSHK